MCGQGLYRSAAYCHHLSLLQHHHDKICTHVIKAKTRYEQNPFKWTNNQHNLLQVHEPPHHTVHKLDIVENSGSGKHPALPRQTPVCGHTQSTVRPGWLWSWTDAVAAKCNTIEWTPHRGEEDSESKSIFPQAVPSWGDDSSMFPHVFILYIYLWLF